VVEKPTICRVCGSDRSVTDLGAIPDSDYFAGRVLLEPLAGGRLFHCRSCRSMFRHPIFSASKYLELYEHGNPTQWSGGLDRRDLSIVRSEILASPGLSKILDVGCGTGDFLFSLPNHFQKFGIEPSDAANHAELRGVEIVARQIDNLPANARFNVVTMIDVIEHVVDPTSLLIRAYAHLEPGGKIVISTGDPDCPIWRQILKSRFWYVSFPEHITFPSFGFCQDWCEKHDAVALRKLATRYHMLRGWRLALNFLMQGAFYVSPNAFSWVGRVAARLRGSPTPRRQTFSPGVPGLFVDHQIVVIEKPRV
jgi:2-polyprenyl-3-methyl-5-hydroxy-6-metoxy-1,4-benzoquinol methylase